MLRWLEENACFGEETRGRAGWKAEPPAQIRPLHGESSADSPGLYGWLRKAEVASQLTHSAHSHRNDVLLVLQKTIRVESLRELYQRPLQ